MRCEKRDRNETMFVPNGNDIFAEVNFHIRDSARQMAPKQTDVNNPF